MEDETMELRDLPVDTRNYTIIDNITGKPIEYKNYTLTIDPQVVNKLNELKKMNEEKVRQASLKSQYGDDTLVDTFTPEDHAVFTPVYEGEYIHAQDFKTTPVVEETQAEEKSPEEEKVEELFNPTEVIQQDTLLDRVVARDPSAREAAIMEETQAEEGEPSTEENTPAVDNSVFTPEKTGLEEASEQIIKIDTEKLGPAIKPPKEQKEGAKRKIPLDVMEIKEAKGYAWLAYILFFFPLLINRKNRFVRVHANEGLYLNILELLGALLTVPYFVLTDVSETVHQILLGCSLLGIVLIAICALTVIPMIICAMCGLQFQIPWLLGTRLIKVAKTRE